MLQLAYSDEFVLGTGESHTVNEFVEAVLKDIKIELKWIGGCIYEVGIFNGET
jgi:GDP-D-mannose dehydratase